MTKYAMLVDYRWCSGCQSCEVSCKNEKGLGVDDLWGVKVLENGPAQITQDVWNWDKIPAFSSVCDLCADRVEAGGTPPCVLHCLANCLEFGPEEEMYKRMAEKDHKVFVVKP